MLTIGNRSCPIPLQELCRLIYFFFHLTSHIFFGFLVLKPLFSPMIFWYQISRLKKEKLLHSVTALRCLSSSSSWIYKRCISALLSNWKHFCKYSLAQNRAIVTTSHQRVFFLFMFFCRRSYTFQEIHSYSFK